MQGMGNVVSFQERAIKRLQQDQSIQVMLYGAAREDALFVSSVSPDHAAIKILKQSSTYKFMSAVAANSLHKARFRKISNRRKILTSVVILHFPRNHNARDL